MEVTSSLRSDEVKRHSVCGLNVYEVNGHRGTESLKSEDHLVALLKGGGKLSVWWEGLKKLREDVLAGDVYYVPPGSTVSCEHHDRIDSAFIKLKQSTFATAATGHIEYSKIDFTGRLIRQQTTSSLASALLSVGIANAYYQWPMLIESASLSLALALISALSPGASMAFREKPYGLSDFRMNRLVEFIDANLHRHITLAEMAELCTVSQFHFSRLFKKRTGMTVMQFIGMRRVERSKNMLQTTGMTLAQIAHDCGFSSQSHFTGVFKLDTGITPAAYRRATL